MKYSILALNACFLFSIQAMEIHDDGSQGEGQKQMTDQGHNGPAQAAAMRKASENQMLLIQNNTDQKVQIEYRRDGEPALSIVLDRGDSRKFPLETNPEKIISLEVMPYGEIKGRLSKTTLGFSAPDYKDMVKTILRADATASVRVSISSGKLSSEGLTGMVTGFAVGLLPAWVVEPVQKAAENYVWAYYVSAEKMEVVIENSRSGMIPLSRKIIDIFPLARDKMKGASYKSIEPRYILGVPADVLQPQVEESYKMLKASWERVIALGDAGDQAFAHKVLQIVENAYQAYVLKFENERLLKE